MCVCVCVCLCVCVCVVCVCAGLPRVRAAGVVVCHMYLCVVLPFYVFVCECLFVQACHVGLKLQVCLCVCECV